MYYFMKTYLFNIYVQRKEEVFFREDEVGHLGSTRAVNTFCMQNHSHWNSLS